MIGITRILTDRSIFLDHLRTKVDYKIKGSYSILIPVYNSLDALFFLSLIKFTNKLKELGIKHKILTCVGTYIAHSREILAKNAFLEDNDFVIWLDSDIVFESNELLYLMESIEQNKYDIISPVIYTRMEPHTPMVYIDKQPIKIPTNEEWTNAEATGFGCLLMNKNLFAKLEMPYFITAYNKGKLVGEDIYFFKNIKQAKLKLGVHLLSRFGHSGGVIWDG